MGIFHRSHHLVALPLSALLLQVFFLPSIIQAAPASQDKCQIFCRAGQASVLTYDAGEYRYNFESELQTEITLASPESRITKVKAEVVVVANSPCDFSLKVNNLHVNNDRGNNFESVGDLNQFPARFTLQDGIIGSICLDENEPTWSANIKRAIISLLQNKALNGVSENEVIESDVSGRCPTKYAIDGDHYVKTKKLNTCLHREGGFSILRGIPYDVNSKFNSVPDLVSEQTCTQTLENGIFKTVKCTELHRLEKFLKKSAGPNLQTSVTTTLTLTSANKGSAQAVPTSHTSKSSIFYDYADHADSDAAHAVADEATLKTLEQICNNIRPDGVNAEVPQLLLDLKKTIEHADKPALVKILQDIKSGGLCAAQHDKLEALFLDTAAQAAGDGTIALLADLYARGELSKVTKRYFYLYTTFAHHPHVESLEALLPLISQPGQKISKRLLLAVSGLAHQYCKTSNPHCADKVEYAAVVNRLAAIVEENALSVEEGKPELAVAALQALGNLDHLTEAAVTAIEHALENGNDRIKTRALDAFRRDPCQANLKKKAQQLFVNENTHANLRIGAYLANLRCLESADAAIIQGVLNNEHSFQVGGFIQSHLKNLLKSASPSTRQLKSAARQLSLQLQYPTELRRFSRHLESSLFNPDLNLGYSAEGSVIFSKESFIPRQLAANLTVDIFGQSYNLIEVGLYLENFDHLQETIFGPHGKFPFDKPITGKAIYNQVLKLRSKRATPGPVAIDSQGLATLESKVTTVDDHDKENGIGDLYIRVFGTTLTVVSLNTEKAPQTIAELKEKVRTLVGGAIETSKKDIHFIHPILLTDDEVIVPTTSGFGISSTLEANVVPSIDYSKDYKAPDANGSPLDLKLKVATNVAASVRGRHSVIGGPVETGIQVEGNLRTGGAVEIVLYKDGEKFEARLNLPNDKVRAFEVSTNVVWVKRGPGRIETKSNFRAGVHAQSESQNHCEEALTQLKYIGLKLCYRADIHTSEDTPFLLNGRQALSASLEKTESSMEGYAILVTKKKDGNNRDYELTLDTPGSKLMNRKLSLTAHVEKDDVGNKKIKMELHTPNDSDIKFEYERTYTETLKGIVAKLTLHKTFIKVDGHIKKTPTGENEITYEPHLSFEYPSNHVDRPAKRTLITGKVVRVPGKKLSVDLSNQLPDVGYDVAPLDIFLKGTVEVRRDGPVDARYDLKGIELGARNRDQDGAPNPILQVNGHWEKSGTQYETDLVAKYGPTLDYEVILHKKATKEPGKLNLKTQVTLTQFPVLNFDLTANVARGEGTYESLISFKLGPQGRQIQLGSESHVVVTIPQGQQTSNFDFQNTLKFNYEPRGFTSSLNSHVKHVLGEEQLIAIKLLSADGQGERTKLTVDFDRKAAQNNDFTLTVGVKAKYGAIEGQLTHTRKALNDEVHQTKGYTASFQHETVFTSSSLGISQEKLVSVIRILNKEDAKGISLNSDLTGDKGLNLHLGAVVKSLSTEIVTNIHLKYKGEELASLEVKGLKDTSNLVLNTYLANQWKIHAQREIKDANHVVTNVNAEILSTGRTVTLDVDRSKTGDDTKIVAELKWDATRDPNQSVKLVSNNHVVLGSFHIDSKNQITVVGQNVELDFVANVPTDISKGEHSASFHYVTADKRSYEVKYSNVLEIDPAHRSSVAKVSVNIPELRQTEISWKVESNNPNLKQLVFDIGAELAVTTAGVNSQNILAKLSAANNNNNDERSIVAKLALGGEAIPENILVDSKLTLGPNSLSTKNSIQVGTSTTGIEIEGTLREEQEVRIANLKYVLTNLPLSKYQKIEGDLLHKRRLGGSIQILRKHEIKLDGKTALSYNYALALLNEKLSAEAKVTSWDKQILDANVKGVSDSNQLDLSGHITVKEENVDVKLHVNKQNPLNLLQIRAETNDDGFSLKLQKTQESPATFALTTNVKYHGNSVQLEGELTAAQNEKGISLKYGKGQGVTKEVKIHYVKDGDNLNFDGHVSVAGQSVKVNGVAQKVSGGYEGQVNYDTKGSKLSENTGIVKFAGVNENTHRKYSFVAGDAAHPIDFFSVDYTKADTPENTHLEGSFSTDVFNAFFEKPKLKGTFSSECKHLPKGHDFATTIHYDAEEVAKGDLQVKIKLLESELHTFVEITDELHSRKISEELHVKKASLQENPRNNVFRWIHKNNLSGSPKTYGITFDSVKAQKGDQQKSLDANLKLILGDENKDVFGVHVYGKVNKKTARLDSGVDIDLPSRQLSVTVVTATKKNGGIGGELNLWMDKKRQAEQKLTVKVDFEKLPKTADGAEGYEYTATVKHPALSKPLTVHRRVLRFGNLIVHDSTTELDLLDDPNNKIVIVLKAAWADESHSQLKTELSIKSEGLGLLLEGKGDITKEANAVVGHLHYSFKNRNGQLNTRNVEVAYSNDHQSILVGEKSDPVLLLSRSVRDSGENRRRRSAVRSSNNVDVRYEIHLPGMHDTRIVDVHLHGAAPPHLNLKTFTTGSDKHYELSLGFPTERQLLLGAYRQVGQQRSNLAELSVALNTTQLLSVKAKWDLETIQQVLKTASERFESTGDHLQSTSEVYIQGVAQDLEHVLHKLSEALPNLTPLLERTKHELDEIKKEWSETTTSQQLKQLVSVVIHTLEAASEPIQRFLQCVNDFPEYLNQLKAKSPTLVKRYEKVVRTIKLAIGKIIKVALQTGRPLVLEIQQLIERIRIRLDGQLKSSAENTLEKVRTLTDSVYVKVVECFLSHADDIGRYLENSNASPEVKEFGVKILRYAVAKLKGQVDEANAIRQEISEKGREAVQKLLGEILTVDLKNGVISALIPLPRPVNSLLDVKNAVRTAWPKAKVIIPYRNRLTSRLNILKQFVRDLASTNLLTAVTKALRTNTPPHSAQAHIIGSQYFITFDGKLFHHEGHCQYLLVSDFVHHHFSVAIDFVNQDGEVRKSLIVADKDETVTIHPDFHVTSAGKTHFEVEETEHEVKVVVEDHEATVVCNKHSDVCTITIDNGYLFGHVAGLLGTYNNEQYDDLRTPDGHSTPSIEAFAESWKLNGACHESVVPQHAPVPSEANKLCKYAFSSRWSPLRSCFDYSDAAEFEKVCRDLSAENGWTVKEAVCTAANAYEKTCSGINFSHLSFCSH